MEVALRSSLLRRGFLLPYDGRALSSVALLHLTRRPTSHTRTAEFPGYDTLCTGTTQAERWSGNRRFFAHSSSLGAPQHRLFLTVADSRGVAEVVPGCSRYPSPVRLFDDPGVASWLPRVGAQPTRSFAGRSSGGRSCKSRDQRWLERFEELKAYAATEGHCRVRHRPEFDGLRRWVGVQREARRAGTITTERVEALEALGFKWAPFEVDWAEMAARLSEFVAAEGHSQVANGYVTAEGLALGRWVSSQRLAHRQGKLSPERVAALEELGMVWDPAESYWQQKFAEMVAFSKLWGHCRVPHEDGRRTPLGTWVKRQREEHRAGQLRKDRFAALEDIGFEWDPHEAFWQERLAELKAFYDLHDHYQVSPIARPQLHSWVRNVRRLYREGKLSAERVEALEAIEFVWDPREQRWTEMFAQLAVFVAREGHSRLSVNHGPEQRLGKWLARQRVAMRKKKLPPHQLAALQRIGVEESDEETREMRSATA